MPYKMFYSKESIKPARPLQRPLRLLPLGSGAVADSASQTSKHIADCQIPAWFPFVPGGEAIGLGPLWTPALDWMTTPAGQDAAAVGARQGCTISICAREKAASWAAPAAIWRAAPGSKCWGSMGSR